MIVIAETGFSCTNTYHYTTDAELKIPTVQDVF